MKKTFRKTTNSQFMLHNSYTANMISHCVFICNPECQRGAYKSHSSSFCSYRDTIQTPKIDSYNSTGALCETLRHKSFHGRPSTMRDFIQTPTHNVCNHPSRARANNFLPSCACDFRACQYDQLFYLHVLFIVIFPVLDQTVRC